MVKDHDEAMAAKDVSHAEAMEALKSEQASALSARSGDAEAHSKALEEANDADFEEIPAAALGEAGAAWTAEAAIMLVVPMLIESAAKSRLAAVTGFPSPSFHPQSIFATRGC